MRVKMCLFKCLLPVAPALVLTLSMLSVRSSEGQSDTPDTPDTPDRCSRQLFCSDEFSTNSPEPWVCTADRAQGRVCSCDMDCIAYGDCCADTFGKCFNMTHTWETVALIEDKLGQVANVKDGVGFMARYVECVRLVPQEPQSLWVVSRCPETVRDLSTKHLCEQPAILPVSGHVGEMTVVFLNVHCASCHGVGETVTWTVDMGVAGCRLLVAQLGDSSQCYITFKPPKHLPPPRACLPDTQLTEVELTQLETSSCSREEKLLCQSYFFPTLGFKNHHCQNCLSPDIYRRSGVLRDECLSSNIPVQLWGGILNMFGTDSNDPSKTLGCRDSQVLDPASGRCQDLVCSYGEQPRHGVCLLHTAPVVIAGTTQLFPSTWQTLHLFMNLSRPQLCEDLEYELGPSESGWILSNVTINVHTNHTTTGTAGTATPVVANHTTTGTAGTATPVLANPNTGTATPVVANPNTGTATPAVANPNTGTATPVVANQTKFPCTEDSAEKPTLTGSVVCVGQCKLTVDFFREIRKYVNQFLKLNLNAFSSRLFLTNMADDKHGECQDGGVLMSYTDVKLLDKDGVVYTMVNTSTHTLLYPLRHVGLEIMINSASAIFSFVIHVCQQPEELFDKNCSVVAYPLNETKLNGTELYHVLSDKSYSRQFYKLLKDRVLVCTDFRFAGWESDDDPLMTIHLAVGGVSTLLLVSLLLVYCRFPQLRNLPGKLTASLAATMALTFLFQMLSTTGIHGEMLCRVLAVLDHVIVLAQFGWTSAFALNMALTFGSSKLFVIMSDHVTYLRYSCVVWGSSTFIVSTALVLDLTHTEADDAQGDVSTQDVHISAATSKDPSYPRYGQKDCIWFAGPPWSVIVFSITPFAVSYVINIVCFFATVAGIHRSAQRAKTLGKKKSGLPTYVIAVKLSTAMGFFWLLNLLNSFIHEAVLKYIFVVFCLLQGSFLFLAFVLNGRVFDLLFRKVEGTNSSAVSREVTTATFKKI